jgi:hypothetical protein
MARLRQSAEQLDALGRWHRILSDERIKIVGRECPRIAAEFLEKTRQKLGPTLSARIRTLGPTLGINRLEIALVI